MSKKKEKSSFSGSLGFVLAAAGSAVGVGNLWRFPYLAARDGGGLFIIVYLFLVATFGFSLLVTDISIGRKTGKSSIEAYAAMRPKWKFLGVITFFVPVLIMTYYCVIGGWIVKYIWVYLSGQGALAADSAYFSTFISQPSSVWWGILFMVATGFIVYKGVEGGIEAASRIMMPLLLVVVVAIAVYCLFLRHTTPEGITRTGLQGLAVYLMPDLTGVTFDRFIQVVLDAMSQLFFSLSVSMGIMITYGSYVKKDVNLNKSISQIELVDTAVALLAGAMIIPAIYVFTGTDGMSAGPSLMFVTLPKVFMNMGFLGPVVGLLFFVMTGFAALTSSISILEAVVANVLELTSASRKKVTSILSVLYVAMTAIVSLGYSWFYFELKLPTGSTGQLLDLMDYISNSLMMPFVTILAAILVGWIVKPDWIIAEMESTGDKFGRKGLYKVMMRYVIPIIMVILFFQSTGLLEQFLH